MSMHTVGCTTSGRDCRSLFIVAFTFDMHIHNMYAAFPGGGALYAFPKHHLLENLNEIMSTHKINTIQCTPSALSVISIDHAASLTSALIAGEALPTGLMQKWVQHVPAFFNFYGPTETDAVTATLCTADMAYPFSIGKPLHNIRGYIVDPADASMLMPPGVPVSSSYQDTKSDVDTKDYLSRLPRYSSQAPSRHQQTRRMHACTAPATSADGCQMAPLAIWDASISR